MSRKPSQPRVVGLGLCVRDEIYRVDEIGLGASSIRYRERVSLPGGMMSNAVMVAAREGVEAHLLSMVGDDTDGRFLASALRKSGVSTRRLIRSRLHPTTTAVVLSQIASGDRRFIVPDRRAMERAAPDFDLSILRPGVVLMIDGHFPRQISRAVRRAKELGVPVVGDFSDAREAFQRWLPHVDYPILPSEFVRGYGAGDVRQTLRLLHRRFGGTPVVTQGEKGALALVGGKFLKVPPRRARVVDTTGAGDAFHGAFAAALAQGADIPTALRRASRRAAAACRHLGGCPPL